MSDTKKKRCTFFPIFENFATGEKTLDILYLNKHIPAADGHTAVWPSVLVWSLSGTLCWFSLSDSQQLQLSGELTLLLSKYTTKNINHESNFSSKCVVHINNLQWQKNNHCLVAKDSSFPTYMYQ